MSADTFDKLSSKELGGFKAYVTGQISFDGKLSALTKFDKNVVAKYNNHWKKLAIEANIRLSDFYCKNKFIAAVFL